MTCMPPDSNFTQISGQIVDQKVNEGQTKKDEQVETEQLPYQQVESRPNSKLSMIFGGKGQPNRIANESQISARSQQPKINTSLVIDDAGVEMLRSSIDQEEEKIADEVIDLGYNIFDKQPQLFQEEIQEIERAKKKRAILRRKQTEISRLSLIEQWVEDWWETYISLEMGLVEMDKCIRMLVNQLLTIGDDQLSHYRTKPIVSPVTGQPLINYKPIKQEHYISSDKIVDHELQINAVMLAMKPGYCNVCFRIYSKEIIKQYLLDLKYKNVESDLQQSQTQDNKLTLTNKHSEQVQKNDIQAQILAKINFVQNLLAQNKRNLNNNQTQNIKKDGVQNQSNDLEFSSDLMQNGDSENNCCSNINAANYIRLQPEDQNDLIERFRIKYFEIENNEELEVHLSRISSQDSHHDDDVNDSLKDLTPTNSEQQKKSNQENLKQVQFKLKQKNESVIYSRPNASSKRWTNRIIPQACKFNDDALYTNIKEFPDQKSKDKYQQQLKSQVFKIGVRNIKQLDKHYSCPKTSNNPFRQQKKMMVNGQIIKKTTREPVQELVTHQQWLKIQNNLGVPKINIMDDQPLFKKMNQNAQFKYRPPIGGQVNNNQLIEQIINEKNSKIDLETFSSRLNDDQIQARPYTQHIQTSVCHGFNGSESIVNCQDSMYNQDQFNQQAEFKIEGSIYDNEKAFQNPYEDLKGWQKQTPISVENRREREILSGKNSVVEVDRQGLENVMMSKKQVMSATDDNHLTYTQHTQPDICSDIVLKNQTKQSTLIHPYQIKTDKINRVTQHSININLAHMSSFRNNTISGDSNAEEVLSQKTMRPAPNASNNTLISLRNNVKQRTKQRNGFSPLRNSCMLKGQELNEIKSSVAGMARNNSQINVINENIEYLDKTDSQEKDFQEEILDFVKSKMNKNNLDEMRQSIPRNSLGHPVQKSYHRNRARQQGRPQNFFNEQYSNFLRQSIEINEEMYEQNQNLGINMQGNGAVSMRSNAQGMQHHSINHGLFEFDQNEFTFQQKSSVNQKQYLSVNVMNVDQIYKSYNQSQPNPKSIDLINQKPLQ